MGSRAATDAPAGAAAADALRGWVRALPPGTAFWYRDIPADVRHAVTSPRAAFDDWPVACRVDGDFCWRASSDATTARVEVRQHRGWMAIAAAGAGAGYGGYSALWRCGWTTQIPARARVVTVAGAPLLELEGLRYGAASENRRRQELTWAETTLLEALLHADLIEPPPEWYFDPEPSDSDSAAWAVALNALSGGETLRRLGPGTVIRIEALGRVAATEPGATETLRRRLGDIATVAGNRIEHPDPTRRVRYAVPPEAGDPFRIPRPEGRSAGNTAP